MARILITGANGMVGRRLVSSISQQDLKLNLAGRRAPAAPPGNARIFTVETVGPSTDWMPALRDCDTVIHLAAALPGRGIEDTEFRQVNDLGTERLAVQALRAGVRRLIMVSSVAVLSGPSCAEVLSDRSAVDPRQAYGRSKFAAERHVARFAAESGGVGIAVRAPLIYAAEAKGKWRLLMRLAASGVPLPLGAVANRRSMLAVDNMADALAHLACGAFASATSGSYLISDATPVSVGDTVRLLREGMRLPIRLFKLPVSPMRWTLTALGLESAAGGLLDDLVVDSSNFRQTFGWTPIVGAEDAIREAGAAFMRMRG